MFRTHVLMLAATLTLAAGALAADSDELNGLRFRYITAKDRIVATYDAAVSNTQSGFTAALNEMGEACRVKGELDAFLAIKQDKDRLARLGVLAYARDGGSPPVLAESRKRLQAKLDLITQSRDAGMVRLEDAYAAQLKAMVVTLTRSNRINEAVLVRNELETHQTGASPPVTPAPGVPAPPPAPAVPATGFKAIFNGHDLTGWESVSIGDWACEDGLLARKKGRDSYLLTKEDYGDFVLELDCRISEGGNSGIFFRADPADPVSRGLELQVLDDPQGKHRGSQVSGSLSGLQAASEQAFKSAGSWNAVRLDVRGSKIKVLVNGRMVLSVDLDDWTKTGRNPDGTPNKFTRPVRELARRGRIAFQNYGSDVWFRNIRIQPLD